MNSFDTSGLDLSMIEDFESEKDIRSYLVSKYGAEFCERVMSLVPLYLPKDYEIH